MADRRARNHQAGPRSQSRGTPCVGTANEMIAHHRRGLFATRERSHTLFENTTMAPKLAQIWEATEHARATLVRRPAALAPLPNAMNVKRRGESASHAHAAGRCRSEMGRHILGVAD
jgi:hypothetical protein